MGSRCCELRGPAGRLRGGRRSRPSRVTYASAPASASGPAIPRSVVADGSRWRSSHSLPQRVDRRDNHEREHRAAHHAADHRACSPVSGSGHSLTVARNSAHVSASVRTIACRRVSSFRKRLQSDARRARPTLVPHHFPVGALIPPGARSEGRPTSASGHRARTIRHPRARVLTARPVTSFPFADTRVSAQLPPSASTGSEPLSTIPRRR